MIPKYIHCTFVLWVHNSIFNVVNARQMCVLSTSLVYNNAQGQIQKYFIAVDGVIARQRLLQLTLWMACRINKTCVFALMYHYLLFGIKFQTFLSHCVSTVTPKSSYPLLTQQHYSDTITFINSMKSKFDSNFDLIVLNKRLETKFSKIKFSIFKKNFQYSRKIFI